MVQWWSRSQSSMVIRSSRFGQASQTTSSCRLMSSCDPPSSQAPTAGHHPEDSSRVGTLGCWDKWKAWKFLGKDPWNNYGKWFDVLLAPLFSECIGILQRLPLFDKCQAIRWSGHGCWAWAGIPRGHMGSWTASPPDFRSEHVRSSIDTSGIARPQGANRHSIYLWKLFVIYIYIFLMCQFWSTRVQECLLSWYSEPNHAPASHLSNASRSFGDNFVDETWKGQVKSKDKARGQIPQSKVTQM